MDELRALRRSPFGTTVETLTSASTICLLLGAGDPYLAYTRLQHALIDATIDRSLRAASASLGFSSGRDTHLGRLDDAGNELGLDQRQVRRLSDQGLATLATLICTNWTVEAVPELTAIVTSSQREYAVVVTTSRPFVVEMSDPEIALLIGRGRQAPEIEWTKFEQNGAERELTHAEIVVPRATAEMSVAIVWRGELWPKFTVHWRGEVSAVASEGLGNKLMLRLASRPVE